MNYISNLEVSPYIQHFGVLGMHWGVRRYQNADGTLTAAGRSRYGNVDGTSERSRNTSSKRSNGGGGGTSGAKTAKKVATAAAITAGTVIAGYATYKLGSLAIRNAAVLKSNKAAKKLLDELGSEVIHKRKISSLATKGVGIDSSDLASEIANDLSADYYRSLAELNDTNRALSSRNKLLKNSTKYAAQYLLNRGNWDL